MRGEGYAYQDWLFAKRGKCININTHYGKNWVSPSVNAVQTQKILMDL